MASDLIEPGTGRQDEVGCRRVHPTTVATGDTDVALVESAIRSSEGGEYVQDHQVVPELRAGIVG